MGDRSEGYKIIMVRMCVKTLTILPNVRLYTLLLSNGRRTLIGGFRRISKNRCYENPCTTVIGHVVELKQGQR